MASESTVIDHDPLSSANSLTIDMPVISLLKCDGHTFLCIGEVNDILVAGNSVNEIDLDSLHDNSVNVSYQMMYLVPTVVSDDPQLKYDWKTSQQHGKACFLTEDDIAERNFRREKECPICVPTVDFSGASAHRVLEHNAGHILFDQHVNVANQPCGLCLRPVPACSFYLKKGKGEKTTMQMDVKKSMCANKLGFQYQTAMESTKSTPCSNAPIPCPLCPKSALAIWQYNLRYHLKDAHRVDNLEPHSHLSTITHIKKHPRRSTKDSALVISEAHSTHLTLRYELSKIFLDLPNE
ncbi:hypothetical protein CPB84DRAFT_1817928 [Gymnopilus junonius]|uniref:Uncharacterized protein n=1 Tax=Gymnopilus junonius TaxID=109634 RepID=A0A9P5NB25_GYMJU|nr:hypothetical protein CPB84DRAFT_1817928 [Gymnopilus junonius]